MVGPAKISYNYDMVVIGAGWPAGRAFGVPTGDFLGLFPYTVQTIPELSMVSMTDPIIALDDGVFVESGRHQILMAAGSLYSELYGL